MEIVLLYVLLLFIFHAFESRSVGHLKMVLATTLLFVTYSVSTSTQSYFTSAGMFHAIPRHSVISFKEGSKLYISSNPEFPLDTNAYNFYIRNYAISEGILEKIYLNNTMPLDFPSLNSRRAGPGTLIQFGKTTVFRGPYAKFLPPVDYQLLVDAKYPKNPEMEVAGKPIFLLGGSTKQKTAERWKQVIQGSGNAFHDLRLTGALLLN